MPTDKKFDLEGFSVDKDNVCTATGGFVGDIVGNVASPTAQYTSDGAVDPSRSLVKIASSVETLEMTLADGVDGSFMRITTQGGSSNNITIVISSFEQGSQIVFDAEDEFVELSFITNAWVAFSTNATIS